MIGRGFFGAAVSRRLIVIGWSERELARRLGASQAQVSRITHSQGKFRLSVEESTVLDKIATFITDNPIPRRNVPRFLAEPEQGNKSESKG